MSSASFVRPNQRRLLGAIAAVTFVASNPAWAQRYLAPTNFGSQSIGTTSGSQTLTFTGLPTGLPLANGAEESSGLEFTAVPTCSPSACTVSVTFTPKYPGLRQDAVLVVDGEGFVIGIGLVYGIGTGPQIASGPGVISTVANRASSHLSAANLGGVTMGHIGQFYVSDQTTNSVYYISPRTGLVMLYAGNGTRGYSGDGNVATAAELNLPSALAFDPSGNLYIVDSGNNVIREVIAQTPYNIETIAGNGTAGFSGDGGLTTSAELDGPSGIAIDAQGNLYIADSHNQRIREVAAVNGVISPSSTISTFAGNGTQGFSGDGAAATSASLNLPWSIAFDANGNLFIADSGNNAIREVSGGNISTVAGMGGSGNAGYSGDGGPATSALLNMPEGIALDAGGSLYIGDTNNNVIRKVTGDSSHTISTFAGSSSGAAGYLGDGGPATSAKLNGPSYLTLDAAGNLFVVDSGNFAIREISAAAAALTFSNSGPIMLTVSNTGNQALTLSGIAASGDFSQSGGTCSTSSPLAAGTSCTIDMSLSLPATGVASAAFLLITSNSLYQSGLVSSVSLTQSAGLHFIPMTPCRAVDTRVSDGFSGTYLSAGSTRSYVLPSTPNCTIPSNALAYSLNVTVVPHTHLLSFLTLWPHGQTLPLVSVLNSGDGRIKANAAIVPADTSGGISVFTTDDTELMLDVNGYFVSSAASNYNSGMVFYPITPCRVADTRNANGSFGGPSIGGQSSRDFPISSSSCTVNVSANAQSYALNVTAIPKSGTLTYLTAWPTGQPQPVASVLNAPTGTVMANAAIIPAGTPNGSVSVYASDPADVVIDINGYFAPPATGGLSLYTMTPCRAVDTRTPPGALPFVGTFTVNLTGNFCNSPAAQAYVFNVTATPQAALAYLTVWQAYTAQPLESTLNADDATAMSNLALVPMTNGAISAYASDSTYLILDIFGYWAP